MRAVLSTVRALLRLVLLTFNFFISGLNEVLFAGREIADFEFVFDYLQKDLDQISYIEKLNMQISGEDEDDEYDYTQYDDSED